MGCNILHSSVQGSDCGQGSSWGSGSRLHTQDTHRSQIQSVCSGREGCNCISYLGRHFYLDSILLLALSQTGSNEAEGDDDEFHSDG